jgi:hypothetical protein
VTRIIGSCVLASVLLSVVAVGASTDSVLKLAFGINRFDRFADTAAGVVVLSRRSNGNAHGFDVASFYVDTPNEEDRFSILPIFGHEQENSKSRSAAAPIACCTTSGSCARTRACG